MFLALIPLREWFTSLFFNLLKVFLPFVMHQRDDSYRKLAKKSKKCTTKIFLFLLRTIKMSRTRTQNLLVKFFFLYYVKFISISFHVQRNMKPPSQQFSSLCKCWGNLFHISLERNFWCYISNYFSIWINWYPVKKFSL